MLLVVALPLLYQPLGDWVTLQLSRLMSGFSPGGDTRASGAGQFGVGMLVGLVWLPCVGPTLGAAIALASLGQDMLAAFVVMFLFGLGTASALLFAGIGSARLLQRWRPGLLSGASRAKHILGGMLLLLASSC